MGKKEKRISRQVAKQAVKSDEKITESETPGCSNQEKSDLVPSSNGSTLNIQANGFVPNNLPGAVKQTEMSKGFLNDRCGTTESSSKPSTTQSGYEKPKGKKHRNYHESDDRPHQNKRREENDGYDFRKSKRDSYNQQKDISSQGKFWEQGTDQGRSKESWEDDVTVTNNAENQEFDNAWNNNKNWRDLRAEKKTLVDPRLERERNSTDTEESKKRSSRDDSQNNSSSHLSRYEKNRDYSYRNHSSGDKEYDQFEQEYRRNKEEKFEKVVEINKDLFEMPPDYSLGHCVAEDLRMGSGIAVSFKREFKQVDDLLAQRAKQGGLATLQVENRFIYYLVTKRESTGKPTYETFWSSLKKMRDHTHEKNITKLAIPRIGCGLDRLEWSKVKFMLEFLFRDQDIEITVCNFQQLEDTIPQKDYLPNKIVNNIKTLLEIESYTIILYLATEDGHVSSEMEALAKKFNFLPEFKRSDKQLGKPIRHVTKNYILYGCVVRKNKNDLFDFQAFGKCLFEINKNNRKDTFEYVALQKIHDDRDDDLLNEKVITLLRVYLKNVDIHICPPVFER